MDPVYTLVPFHNNNISIIAPVYSNYLIYIAGRHNTSVLNDTEYPPMEEVEYFLDCFVIEGRPKQIIRYEWYHNDNLMSGKHNKQLQIDKLERQQDEGEYGCAAENIPGMGHPGDTVNITVWCKANQVTLLFSTFCENIFFFVTSRTIYLYILTNSNKYNGANLSITAKRYCLNIMFILLYLYIT